MCPVACGIARPSSRRNGTQGAGFHRVLVHSYVSRASYLSRLGEFLDIGTFDAESRFPQSPTGGMERWIPGSVEGHHWVQNVIVGRASAR